MTIIEKSVSAQIVSLLAVLVEHCFAEAEAIQHASDVAGIRQPQPQPF